MQQALILRIGFFGQRAGKEAREKLAKKNRENLVNQAMMCYNYNNNLYPVKAIGLMKRKDGCY